MLSLEDSEMALRVHDCTTTEAERAPLIRQPLQPRYYAETERNISDSHTSLDGGGGGADARWTGLAEGPPGSRPEGVKALKVRVEGGRIHGDAPAGLPEGEIELCLAEPEEEMSEQEAAELCRALEAGWRSAGAGRLRPASEILAELRAKP